jgi:hypothetical protein
LKRCLILREEQAYRDDQGADEQGDCGATQCASHPAELCKGCADADLFRRPDLLRDADQADLTQGADRADLTWDADLSSARDRWAWDDLSRQ